MGTLHAGFSASDLHAFNPRIQDDVNYGSIVFYRKLSQIITKTNKSGVAKASPIFEALHIRVDPSNFSIYSKHQVLSSTWWCKWVPHRARRTRLRPRPAQWNRAWTASSAASGANRLEGSPPSSSQQFWQLKLGYNYHINCCKITCEWVPKGPTANRENIIEDTMWLRFAIHLRSHHIGPIGRQIYLPKDFSNSHWTLIKKLGSIPENTHSTSSLLEFKS